MEWLVEARLGRDGRWELRLGRNFCGKPQRRKYPEGAEMEVPRIHAHNSHPSRAGSSWGLIGLLVGIC